MSLHRALVAISAYIATACVASISPGVTQAAASEPPPSRSELRKHAERIVAGGAPGAQITTHDKRGVRHVVAGVGNLRTGKPPRAGRPFRIGSVTKTFTATVVLSLVADGRIRLNAPVERYLPGLLPYKEPITVRQLLEHRSGLFDYKEVIWPNPRKVTQARFRNFEPIDLVRIATRRPLQSAPGKTFGYSNTDYVVLGMLVEEVTGHDYEHQLWRQVLRPARLRDTYVPGHDPRLRRPSMRGYEDVTRTRLTDLSRFNMSAAWASGDLVSTADDVYRFYEALLDGRLLPQNLLRQMKQTKPAFPGFQYGLGLAHTKVCNQQIWGHQGGMPGYQTLAFTNGSSERQITVLANRSLTLDSSAKDAMLAAVKAELCGD